MSRRNNQIPGMRRPTAQEQAWIGEHWGKVARERNHHSTGKVPKYIGIFLIATSAVNLVRKTDDIAGVVVVLILAAICLWFSRVARSSARHSNLRLSAFTTGNYLVAPAVATDIRYGRNRKTYTGLMTVCLPDGTPLEGVYTSPYHLTKPLIEKNIHRTSILLIQIPGDSYILAIPVQN